MNPPSPPSPSPSQPRWLSMQVTRLGVTLRNAVLRVIAQGHVPAHVAFIMDGNRRFARRSHVATIKGHAAGFGALEQILDWSMELGVKEVSVYAFSIENFKRPKEEVDGLMDLAEEKFHHMMQENKMIDKLGIRVKVIGDLDMIPEKTRIAIDKVVEYSKHNTKATLNVCFAYTARDEMAKAINTLSCTAHRARAHLSSSSSTQMNESESLDDEERLVRLIKGGEDALVAPPTEENGRDTYDYNDIEKKKLKRIGCESEKTRWGEELRDGDEGGWGWEDEMWRAMMIKTAPDLIVRTSGEIRLSDYMLWQTAFSIVVFLNVLWPDFSVWHFLYVILVYQYNYSTMQARRKCYANEYKNNNKSTKEPIEHHLLEDDDDLELPST